MCCHDSAGADPEKYPPLISEPRLKLYNSREKLWLKPTFQHPTLPFTPVHQHWARNSSRIYAHQWLKAYDENMLGKMGYMPPHVHALNVIDIDKNSNEWYACPPEFGNSVHTRISHNEKFFVGDGLNFDQSMRQQEPELYQRYLKKCDELGFPHKFFFDDAFNHADGGETIWHYTLPQNNILDDYSDFCDDPNGFQKAYQQYPDRFVTATPLCKFRTNCRNAMLGYRVEANARTVPDDSAVIFQTSTEEGYFAVGICDLN